MTQAARLALLRNIKKDGTFEPGGGSRLGNTANFVVVSHYYFSVASPLCENKFEDCQRVGLRSLFAEIEQAKSYMRARGGEGIVVKKVSHNSGYKFGARSNLWQKIKLYEDSEALVIDYFTNIEGRRGVRVKLPTGDTSHAVVNASGGISLARIPLHSIINIQYMGVEESGKLREPIARSIVEVYDLDDGRARERWQQIVRDAKQ